MNPPVAEATRPSEANDSPLALGIITCNGECIIEITPENASVHYVQGGDEDSELDNLRVERELGEPIVLFSSRVILQKLVDAKVPLSNDSSTFESNKVVEALQLHTATQLEFCERGELEIRLV